MADIAERLNGLHDSRVVQAGFGFIVVGLGLKAAMFPLHQWLPNAYAYAPSFVTVFLSATATKAAFYALARFTFTVYDPNWDFCGRSAQLCICPRGMFGNLVLFISGNIPTRYTACASLLFGCTSRVYGAWPVCWNSGWIVSRYVPPCQSCIAKRCVVYGGGSCCTSRQCLESLAF